MLRDGDLLLIDAGCEYGMYASDITRTFPVNGRFSPAQKAIYDVVLDAQAVNVVGFSGDVLGSDWLRGQHTVTVLGSRPI